MTDPLLRGELAPEPRTLVDIFRATAAQVPDEPAVDAGNGLLTYAELEEAADDLAAELNAAGIGPGDKVALLLPNTPHFPMAYYGVLALGAVAGDLALAQGAKAVVIAGGLGFRIKDRLIRSGFDQRFVAKGRFQSLMTTIPVKIITYEQPGLYGAAAAFAQEHSR